MTALPEDLRARLEQAYERAAIHIYSETLMVLSETDLAAILAASSPEPGEDERDLIDELTGALRFILAFYEPRQRYLDSNAWIQAEGAGRHALARGEAALAATRRPQSEGE